MRGKDLFEKITDINDELIVEKRRKSTVVKRLIPIAACLAIIISIATLNNNSNIITDPNLPILTITDDIGGSMGFEGYMAFEITDLVNSNPWNKSTKLTHLPVIKNSLTYNEMQNVEKPNYELMEKILKETAKSLDMDIENIAITNDIPTEEEQTIITEKFDGKVPDGYFDISKLFTEDDNYKIKVDTSYTAKVEFKKPVKLPSEYNFANYASYKETQAVAEYLKEKYTKFIEMNSPVVNISGGDYDIYARQHYTLYFYEHSDDATQNILNYHFNNVTFYGNEDGELWLARKYYTDLSDVIGNYPIISVEDATDLLEKGNYITTVPQEFESVDNIKKVELIYRNGSHEKTFMPYYRFYVELPEFKHNDTGLNEYGAYYVPAVESKYIENMPVWDGHFN